MSDNNDNNIVKFPHLTSEEKLKNKYGPFCLQCHITNRWLQFHQETDSSGTLILVDVMTSTNEDKDRKICELCLNINDLRDIINLFSK